MGGTGQAWFPNLLAMGGRMSEGVQRTVQHLWDLTQLASMKPGEWIDFRIAAGDYKTQIGESVSRRLTIISAEELEERLAQRQAEILAQIAEIVRLQRQTHTQTSELEIQVRSVGRLDRNDIDQLQAAELNQRQVQQRLAHPSDGAAAQIVELIEQLRSNRVDSPDLYQRLIQFRDTIERLNETYLSHIQRQLIDALKIARESLVGESNDERAIETRVARGVVRAA